MAEFPEARWMKKLEEGEFNKLKEIVSLQKTELTTHKAKPQDEPDMPQDQRNPQASSLTLIDLTGSHQNDDKVGSVSQKLRESTSGILPESQDSPQGLSMNLAHPNKPSPPNHSPEPPNMSEGHYPPAPPIVAEAYVASQHSQHLLDTLPAFSDELSPLTMSTGQARLMGIGLEQNSSNAFAEIAATNAQLTLTVNNEGMTLEGDVYIILRYPRADTRPWNALVETHSLAQSMHSSAASTRISSPDTSQIGSSDQRPENSGSSTTNVPNLGHPPFRGPGALETAPALSTTTALTLPCTSRIDTGGFPGQVLPFVAEPGENHTHDDNAHLNYPLPSQQHLPPRLARALELPPREPTPISRLRTENVSFRGRNG